MFQRVFHTVDIIKLQQSLSNVYALSHCTLLNSKPTQVFMKCMSVACLASFKCLSVNTENKPACHTQTLVLYTACQTTRHNVPEHSRECKTPSMQLVPRVFKHMSHMATVNSC